MKHGSLVSYYSLTCFNLDLLDGNQGMLLRIYLVHFVPSLLCVFVALCEARMCSSSSIVLVMQNVLLLSTTASFSLIICM